LALVVMIGCAPALSSPTDQERSPNPLPPSVEGSASEESRVFETEPPTSGETETVPGFSPEQSGPSSENELSERSQAMQADRTEGEGGLIFPLVLVGEGELVEEKKTFLSLVTKSGEPCANRVVRTGDELTFNGREIRLIGMNVAYILEEWFPESQWEGVLSFWSRSGNVIRTPVFPEHAQDGGLDRVERLIRLGGKYGLRFIIVLDAYMAADYPIKGEAWFHSGYKGEYMDHLTNVATRLRGVFLRWRCGS